MLKQAFLHGSAENMNIGDIVVPGETLGKNNNGGKNDNVYFVSTQGYSLTECEGSEGFNNTFEYAVDEAYWWGDRKFIYVVEPMGTVLIDNHFDVSPACLMSSSAKIINKFAVKDYESLTDLYEEIKASV